MSRTKQIIEIEPYVCVEEESLVMAPVTCPSCNGRGSYLNQFGLNKSASIQKCAYCKGSGKIYAKVTIDWKPYKNENQTGVEKAH